MKDLVKKMTYYREGISASYYVGYYRDKNDNTLYTDGALMAWTDDFNMDEAEFQQVIGALNMSKLSSTVVNRLIDSCKDFTEVDFPTKEVLTTLKPIKINKNTRVALKLQPEWARFECTDKKLNDTIEIDFTAKYDGPDIHLNAKYFKVFPPTGKIHYQGNNGDTCRVFYRSGEYNVLIQGMMW
jgi:hypothetical protein